MVAGLTFALVALFSKTVVVRYADFCLVELNYNSNGLFALLLIGPMIWLIKSGQLVLSWPDVALSVATYMLSNTGALCSNQSIKYGKAGVV